MVVYLNEISVDDKVGEVVSRTATIYEHMLKWKYWEDAHYGQDRSWPEAIFRSIVQIRNIGITKNMHIRANKILYKKGYLLGAVRACKRDRDNNIIIDTKKLDDGELFNNDGFNTIDKLLDMVSVRDWLIAEKRSEKAKGYVIEKYNNYKNR